jgi:hypothetical protein
MAGTSNFNGSIFQAGWIDSATEIYEHDSTFEIPDYRYYHWGPNGYGDPYEGFWRAKDGSQVNIETMVSPYLVNCIKFLRDKFGKQSETWPIYIRLQKEAIRRGIDDRTEWDI